MEVAHNLEGPSAKHGTTVEPGFVYHLDDMTSLSSGESFDVHSVKLKMIIDYSQSLSAVTNVI